MVVKEVNSSTINHSGPLPKPPFNILMISAGSGRRYRLVKYTKKALEKTGLGNTVVCADSARFAPGLYQFDGGYCVPEVSDPSYNDAIMSICKKHKINLLIPTADHDLLYWCKKRKEAAAAGIFVLISPESTIDCCLKKTRINKLICQTGINVPKILSKEEVTPEKLPIVCKPIYGRGTRDTYFIHSSREWMHINPLIKNHFIQKYIDGIEYTVDVLSGLDGQPVLIIPRERIATRAGVSDTGRTVKDKRLTKLALIICEQLPFIGPINIQFIAKGDQFFFIEINPRFSGGISCSIAAAPEGKPNLVDFLMRILAGERIEPDLFAYREDIIMMVYEEALHMPYESILDKEKK